MSKEPTPSSKFDRRYVISGDSEEAESIKQTILDALESVAYDQTSCYAIRLALEEALTNAFKHGNQSDPSKSVTVECCIEQTSVRIDIQDEGEGFDPSTVPDPTEEENIEIPSGRGIMLMRAFMTDVQFHPPGNRVSIVYQKP